MRNATCAASKTSKVPTQDALLFISYSMLVTMMQLILDLHVGHVGGEVQNNILSILLWASAVVGELHCLVIPDRLVARQG